MLIAYAPSCGPCQAIFQIRECAHDMESHMHACRNRWLLIKWRVHLGNLARATLLHATPAAIPRAVID